MAVEKTWWERADVACVTSPPHTFPPLLNLTALVYGAVHRNIRSRCRCVLYPNVFRAGPLWVVTDIIRVESSLSSCNPQSALTQKLTLSNFYSRNCSIHSKKRIYVDIHGTIQTGPENHFNLVFKCNMRVHHKGPMLTQLTLYIRCTSGRS